MRARLTVVLRGQLNAAQGGRTCVARAGDLMSYETSHPVVCRADQPFESLVVRVPREALGHQAAQISNLTAVKRIPGNEPLPRAAVAFLRGLAGGLEDGTIKRRMTLRTPSAACSISFAVSSPAWPIRGDPKRPRSRAEILLNVQSFIEARHRRPRSRSRRDRPRDLHLDEVPAQAVRRPRARACASGSGPRGSRAAGATCSIRRSRDQTILAIATRWGLPGPQHF